MARTAPTTLPRQAGVGIERLLRTRHTAAHSANAVSDAYLPGSAPDAAWAISVLALMDKKLAAKLRACVLRKPLR